ncbi:hypothetical protein NLJ89_g3421 [Agrocybe chaxingu]|uniref:HMG box domain-containing protein n=1 Tax=Agrocybe chaxingu TaxID=84603 RepID=A0A9W8K4R3_9AGAR|nr:hypothetical protein NLJ89_g3421 [Agrocybe chaxingu]
MSYWKFRGTRFIGTDTLHPDETPAPDSNEGPDGIKFHQLLLGAEGVIAENLTNLVELEEELNTGRDEEIVSQIPLKLIGADGSPVRASYFTGFSYVRSRWTLGACGSIQEASVVLINMGWSWAHHGTETYLLPPYLTPEVAQELLARGVRVIGTDTLKPDETPGSDGNEGPERFRFYGSFSVLTVSSLRPEALTALEELVEALKTSEDEERRVVSLIPPKLAGAHGSRVRACAFNCPSKPVLSMRGQDGALVPSVRVRKPHDEDERHGRLEAARRCNEVILEDGKVPTTTQRGFSSILPSSSGLNLLSNMPVYRSAYLCSLVGYEHYENAAPCLEADYFTPSPISSHLSHHATYGADESQTVSPSDMQSSPSPTPASPSDTLQTPPANAKTKQSNHARHKDPNYIPRPRNAFIIFRSSFIASRHRDAAPCESQNEMSKQAAVVWNGMSAKERKPFQDRALLEKAEHLIKYPGYSYAPGGASAKGKNAGKNKSKSKQAKNQRQGGDAPSPSPLPSSPTSCGGPATPQQPFAPASAIPLQQAFLTTPYDEAAPSGAATSVKEKLDTTARPFNYSVIDSQFAGRREYPTANEALLALPSAAPLLKDDGCHTLQLSYVTPFALPISDHIRSPPVSTLPLGLALPHPDTFTSLWNPYFKRRGDSEAFDFGGLPIVGGEPAVQYAQGMDGLWYPVQYQKAPTQTAKMGLFFDYHGNITGYL